MKPVYLVLIAVCFTLESMAQNCPPIDPAFGNKGVTEGPLGRTVKVLTQSDGKVILIGNSITGVKAFGFLKRFTAEGIADNQFGDQGGVIMSANNTNLRVEDAVIMPSGKILVCGTSDLGTGERSLLLAQFKPNGEPDLDFGGTNGMLTFLTFRMAYSPSSIAVDPAGTGFLVAGTILDNALICNYNYQYPKGFVTKFNNNGQIDEGFGVKGTVVFSGPTFDDYAIDAAFQPNGRILLSTSTGTNCVCNDDSYYGFSRYCVNRVFKVHRLFANGTADPGFGYLGTIEEILVFSDVNNVIGLADGSILLCGQNAGTFIIKKYRPDGKQDPGFGESGQFSLYVKSAIGVDGSLVHAALVQRDSKIYLAGEASDQEGAILVRVNADGTLDKGFFNKGIVLFDFGDPILGNSALLTIAEQGDALILGGEYRRGTTVLVRVNSSDFILNPKVLINGNVEFCNGDSVTLSSSIPGNNFWFWNNRAEYVSAAQNLRVSNSGEYRVMVTTDIGCGISDPIAVKQNPLIQPSFPSFDGKYLSTDTGFAKYVWVKDNIAVDSVSGHRFNPGTALGVYRVDVYNKAGCKGSSLNFNYVVTGLNNVTVGDATVRLYPNPTRQKIILYNKQPAAKKLTADIIDLNGRIVKSAVLRQGTNEISLPGLRSGVYAAIIRNGTERVVISFMLIQ